MAEERLSILATSARSRGMAKMGAGTKQLMGAYRLRLWVPLTGNGTQEGAAEFQGDPASRDSSRVSWQGVGS